jgi:hypothetical protein
MTFLFLGLWSFLALLMIKAITGTEMTAATSMTAHDITARVHNPESRTIINGSLNSAMIIIDIWGTLKF